MIAVWGRKGYRHKFLGASGFLRGRVFSWSSARFQLGKAEQETTINKAGFFIFVIMRSITFDCYISQGTPLFPDFCVILFESMD